MNNFLSAVNKIEKDFNKKSLEALELIAQELLKDSQDLVPKDTGTLAKMGRVYKRGNSYVVAYETPYAKFVYYGTRYIDDGSVAPYKLKWTEVAFEENADKYVLIFEKKIHEN